MFLGQYNFLSKQPEQQIWIGSAGKKPPFAELLHKQHENLAS